jgi:hypothetical protein
MRTFCARSGEAGEKALNATDRMIDQLDAPTKPTLLLLIVEFIEMSILRAGHKYSTVRSSCYRYHLHVTWDRHVQVKKFDFLASGVIRTKNVCRGDPQEDDSQGSAQYE